MKSIHDAYMKCPECGWTGKVRECGNEEHEDGELDCPQCHSACVDDFLREKQEFWPEFEQNFKCLGQEEILRRFERLFSRQTPLPAAFVVLVDDHFWELA